MQHADKLIERIIFLDGFPNMEFLNFFILARMRRKYLSVT